jgi:hypothetical protein
LDCRAFNFGGQHHRGSAMTDPNKGGSRRLDAAGAERQRQISDQLILSLLAKLAELEKTTRPQDGPLSARGKDRKAVQALNLANQLVRAVAGWAIDHQIGLALQGEASAPNVLPELMHHPLHKAALAKVDDHRHEVEGAKNVHGSIQPSLARQALLNLLLTNPGAFPQTVVSITIHALEGLDYNETSPIFRPLKGRRKVGLSELYMQLNALVWVAHYVGRGFKKNEALQRVSDAFGVSTATIRSWNRRVRTELGALTVEIHLEAAGVYDDRHEDLYDEHLITSGKDYLRLLSQKN